MQALTTINKTVRLEIVKAAAAEINSILHEYCKPICTDVKKMDILLGIQEYLFWIKPSHIFSIETWDLLKKMGCEKVRKDMEKLDSDLENKLDDFLKASAQELVERKSEKQLSRKEVRAAKRQEKKSLKKRNRAAALLRPEKQSVDTSTKPCWGFQYLTGVVFNNFKI